MVGVLFFSNRLAEAERSNELIRSHDLTSINPKSIFGYSIQSACQSAFWISLATRAQGPHPFPFRTRPLRPAAPMVLRPRGRGRVGRRRHPLRKPRRVSRGGALSVRHYLAWTAAASPRALQDIVVFCMRSLEARSLLSLNLSTGGCGGRHETWPRTERCK